MIVDGDLIPTMPGASFKFHVRKLLPCDRDPPAPRWSGRVGQAKIPLYLANEQLRGDLDFPAAPGT